MNRRGFTFIELMVVVTLLGILVSIAAPQLQDVKRRAIAADVIADYSAVRYAAHDSFAELGTFPATAGWGQIPPEMVGSLRTGFSFSKGDITYRWHRWSLPNGMPQNPSQTVLLEFEVRGTDPKVITAIRNAFGGRARGGGLAVALRVD